MSAAKEVTKDKIKPEVYAMEKEIASKLTFDKKTHEITVADKAYVEIAKAAGLDKETIEKVVAHNATFAAAAVLALGNIAEPAMKKDKTLEKVTMKIPTVMRDSFTASYDRSRTVPNMGDGGKVNGTKEIYGVTSAKWESLGIKNRAQMANVKELLSAQATASFGSTKK